MLFHRSLPEQEVRVPRVFPAAHAKPELGVELVGREWGGTFEPERCCIVGCVAAHRFDHGAPKATSLCRASDGDVVDHHEIVQASRIPAGDAVDLPRRLRRSSPSPGWR